MTGKKRRATREGEQKEMYEDQDLMALKEEQGQEQGKRGVAERKAWKRVRMRCPLGESP